MSRFGELVAKYRSDRGMTQRKLAELSGLDATHLNRIEKGTRPPPQAQKFLRMVDALKLSEGELKELGQLGRYGRPVLLTKTLKPTAASLSTKEAIGRQLEMTEEHINDVLRDLAELRSLIERLLDGGAKDA